MVYYIITIIITILVVLGVFFLLSYKAKLPTTKSEKVMNTVITLDNPNKSSLVNNLLGKSSKILLSYITLDDSRKYKIANALNYLNYNITPEQHFANSISAGVIVGLLTCILGFVHPLFLLFAVVLGGLIFKLEYEKPVKEYEEIKEKFELECSQLAKFIADALNDGNRNVIAILNSCKESVCNTSKKELERTITDMKTGNQEKALTNMSIRMSSSNVTQIVVGLLGVLRGDNQTMYFEALAEKFHREELTYVRKKNSTKPGIVSKLSIVLIFGVVAQIMVGIVLSLMEELSKSGMF